jgi:hypothetical protein
MPSKSRQQQKFMGIVRSIQKGDAPAGKFSKAAQKAAKSMKKSSVRKYAKTKHGDLPKKVKEEKKRDYKDEYKKFQSSPKMKKYRAELNKYNRKKGTYGNGDGKDASHKGGKIVGFESQSKNRGRAEKSRLKKESINEQEMSIKDAFKDLVKDHGSKKALDILTSVLTGGIGFEDPKKKKKFQQKLLKKMTTEAKLNENPAAIAAAQRMVVQSKSGKVSVNTARQSSYAKKDPSTHKKAKSMWQKIKDKFSKKEVKEVTYQFKGYTNTQMDELDAMLARAGVKGTPDFNKMTYTTNRISKNLDTVVKRKGGKKIQEGTCGYGIDGKLGKKPAGPDLLKKDDLEESKDPDIISQLRGVLKKGYSSVKDPVSGKKMKVDTYTASAITKVYDAINTSNKKKFSKLPLLKMQSIAMRFVK